MADRTDLGLADANAGRACCGASSATGAPIAASVLSEELLASGTRFPSCANRIEHNILRPRRFRPTGDAAACRDRPDRLSPVSPEGDPR
ncbi:hypothetical protein QE381_000455 [Microbacterium sp. SORGH_AS 888]|nr:hypothetical protein [Microbacterium sp. SORGH_AS_0888]